MTDMILTQQTLAQMLLNFLGPLPEQINTMNMIYTLYYNPADWNTLKNKPLVIAAGNTQAEARNAIDVPSTSDLLLVATALAERIPAYTQASVVKVSQGSSPYTPGEVVVTATTQADTIAKRTATGTLSVADATGNGEAVTLGQLNTRMPAWTAANRVKVSNGSSPFTPTEVAVSQSPAANAIPRFDASGRLQTTAAPNVRTTVPTVQTVRDYALFNQPAHTAKAASATLTAAELLTKIIVADTTAALVNLTLPLAADLDTALAAAYGTLAVGDAIKFKVINQSSSGSFGSKIITNTGWTIIGSTDIGNWFYGEFIARRTAAGAYTLYRA